VSIKRVLFVDDEPAIVKCMSQMVKLLGYEVIPASGGTEAYKKFVEAQENGGLEIVITDFKMAEGDGVTLAKEIRRGYSCREVYIIGLTGWISNIPREDAVLFDEILPKPPIMAEVIAALDRAYLNLKELKEIG